MTRFFARVSARVGQAYTKLFPNTLKKRTWWPVFGVGVLLIAAMSVGIAYGQAALVEGLLNGIVDVIATILIELSKLCIFLTIFFLRAFITLASYNNFIDVSVVKLGWVMVRDVANMFFIVGLLVIAFATILGFESYEWKHGLVKIVLMAILINFSNLIAQLVIDVAHIFTITFLNAVSATAGGNLITMFQMDKVLELSQSSPSELGVTREVASLTLFAGAVLAFIFALLAALTIGAYMVVMIFRIVVLWALIVLSPLAFMLYAVPKGEEYAHEWWSEFSKHVIVAPIMVFFLWLAFATLGTGQIISEIQSDPNVIQLNSSGEKQSVTVLEISTWENFASFLLGIGFLWVGIKKTEETGATGAGLVGSALDFTKNVATIATGYAAGRWLVGGAVDKVKSDFPIIGGKSLARKGMMIKGAYNYAKSKTGIGRDAKVQDWEKDLKEAVQKGKIGDILKFGALRFGVGGFIASSKKKDAVAETWEEKAHMADEEHEARISNSGTWGGTGKDEQRIRTELAVKLKQEKGIQKGAEGLIRLMNEKDDQVMTDLDKIAETKALAHDLEAVADTRQKKIDAQKVDELEQGHGKASKKLHEAREELATLKPITEQIEQKIAADHHGHEEERLEQLLAPISPLEMAEYAAVSADPKLADRKKEMEKDFKEREEYQKYNDLATEAEKKLENVKGSNKAQADLSAAQTEAQLALAAAMSKSPSKYAEREGVIAESQTRMKGIQDRRNAEKEILLLEEIAKLLASGGLGASLQAKAGLEKIKLESDIAQKEAMREAERIAGLSGVRAGVENRQETLDLDRNKEVLLSRASLQRGKGDFLKAGLLDQQANSLEFNKLKEVFKTAELGSNERANLAAQLVEKMQEVWADTTLSVSARNDKLAPLIRQKDSLNDLSSTLGSYDALREEEEELRQVGWTENINLQNVGRRFLSRKLGRVVGVGDETAALGEYQSIVGPAEFKVRMRQLGAHAKNQKAQGNVGAYVFNEEAASEIDPSGVKRLTGLTDYKIGNPTEAEVLGQMSGWLKSGDLDVKKMREAVGTRRLSPGKGGGSVLRSISRQEAVFNAEALGNFTTQSIAAMGKRGFIGDINSSAIDRVSLTEQLEAFAVKADRKEAFDALTKNLSDTLNRLSVDQAELDGLWNLVRPESPPAAPPAAP